MSAGGSPEPCPYFLATGPGSWPAPASPGPATWWGTQRSRHNVASALVASLAGGTDLPRLEQARLRVGVQVIPQLSGLAFK